MRYRIIYAFRKLKFRYGPPVRYQAWRLRHFIRSVIENLRLRRYRNKYYVITQDLSDYLFAHVRGMKDWHVGDVFKVVQDAGGDLVGIELVFSEHTTLRYIINIVPKRLLREVEWDGE